MKANEKIERTTEIVNIQIGFLIGCIEHRKDQGEKIEDLEQLLLSLTNLKIGLETNSWSGTII